MHYRNVTRRGFTAAVKKAELDTPGEPRLRLHDLRHTFASLLIAEGLNIIYVSRQLGHASPSFTLNVYSHLFDRAEHGTRATDALESRSVSRGRLGMTRRASFSTTAAVDG